MRRQIFISLAIFLILILGTVLVIIYGKGYQIRMQSGRPEIAGTGLMVLTSTPDGASVFINDKLTTATNNTINLAPGRYKVKIFKQGYFTWQKTLNVEKEVVSKADALLLPSAPKLESITDTGLQNPTIDPTGTKIAYTISGQSGDKKNGIYVLSMNSNPIPTLQITSTQITDDTYGLFSKALLSWSPDGENIVATVSSNFKLGPETTYLLPNNGFVAQPKDVTDTISGLMSSWNTLTKTKQDAQIQSLRPELSSVVSDSFEILAWSSDETKILYKARKNRNIPFLIVPGLIGADPTPENRNITVGKVYVYDVKEDKNYKIPDTNISSSEDQNLPLKWLPDSKHLIRINDKKIEIMEYDGTNRTTIYAGPFIDNYVFPWPDGSKVVILTDLGNNEILPNLYTISLK